MKVSLACTKAVVLVTEMPDLYPRATEISPLLASCVSTPFNLLVYFFEAFDENWKGSDDPFEPEKHWGIYKADRSPKLAMKAQLSCWAVKTIELSDKLSISNIVYGMWRLTDDQDTSAGHIQNKIEACLEQGIDTFDLSLLPVNTFGKCFLFPKKHHVSIRCEKYR